MVGERLFDPLADSAPLQPPPAVQAVAFVVDQVKVALAPGTTEVGLADIVTVGAGGVAAALTVTVTVVWDVPAELEHANV